MDRCIPRRQVFRHVARISIACAAWAMSFSAHSRGEPARVTHLVASPLPSQDRPAAGRPDPGSDPAANAPQEAWVRGLIDASRFQEAESVLRAGLDAHPASPELLYLLGEVELRLNKPGDSLAALTRAAALRRPSGEALRLVGLDYILLDDNRDAVRWLEQAVELSPANPEIWYSLGRAYYGGGRYDESRRCFVKTLALAPDSAKAENNLGLALEAEDQPDAALEAYSKAIRLESHSAQPSEQPYLNYGALQIHRGQNAEAADALQHATLLAPSCPQCHETYGRSLLALEQLPAALREFEEAVRLEPGNPRFHYELGRLLKKTGDAARSEQEMRASAALYGSHSAK